MYLVNHERKKTLKVRSLLSGTIYYTGSLEEACIKDLIMIMELYTGVKPIIINSLENEGEGMHLIPQSLGNKDGQQFDIEVTPTKATIWYSEYTGVNNSLSNGIYYLLNHLGIEWLCSNENGLDIPDFITIAPLSKQTIIPDFRDRVEFGTGGLFNQIQGGDIEYYKGKSYSERWYDFIRRNRYGADFPTQGHAGGAFYYQNQTICDQNATAWFSDYVDEHGNQTGKLYGRIRIEVPAAVECYKQWAYQQYTAAVSRGDQFITIGVDPEDGRGGADDPLPVFDAGKDYATMPDCKKIYNHADKWWWLANEVSKMWDENDSHIKVNMQAYGDGPTNALAPNFELRKNILPNINPWSFQTAYKPRQTMLTAWKEKISEGASVYDYINITEWSRGLPQHNLQSSVYKLSLYLPNKVNGLIYETTDANVIAHIHYVLGKLHFDTSLDWKAIYRNWLYRMFGSATGEMKKMFDRWSNNYAGMADPGFSLQNISAALTKVERGSKYWKRILDYAAYIHYCILYYRNDGSVASHDNIFRYLYRIHHLQMVQTPAFLGQEYINKNMARPSGENLTPMSYEEILAQLEQDILDAPVLYQPVAFDFDIRKAQLLTMTDTWIYGLLHPIGHIYPSGRVLNFKVGIIDPELGRSTTFSVSTSDGVVLTDTVSSTNCDSIEELRGKNYAVKQYSINCIPGKLYTVYGARRFQLLTDEIIWSYNENESWDNYQYPWKYIWVPENATEIVMESHENVAPLLRPNDDTSWRASSKMNGLNLIYKIDVPESERGKLWVIAFQQYWHRILNLPNICALQPFTYEED